ncbi:Gfo/Idh/MocA family protein [Thermodesulfobacterium hydrogeniphilum]|uniref:Gfo/Idh/MocA family protein n=1 Tax=Thermodesulfobacterium hydrogeniphilum TaxID=161156 RepID=UPI00056EE591|nr:Gfo/Idh/MocA family oxidoreductase [Thermodesulfobacterium hydrogeniphilum]
MNKLKIAVIGLGHLGKFHAEKLADIQEVDLVALVDINLKQAEKVCKKLKEQFGISPQVFTDYKKILNKIDAVSIVTPTVTHYEICKYFLESGKAVFLEKPLTHDLKQAEELVEISLKKKLPFQIGYIERFQPAVKELLKKVKNPLFIEAHRLSSFVERNLDIDVVLDLMIHDLDLVRLLKPDQEIELIHAVGAPLFTSLPDIVNARIIFKDGTTCNLTASRISLNRQRRFRVFEKGAYYVVDTLERSYLEVKVDMSKKGYQSNKQTFFKSDPLKEELSSFVKSILTGEKVEVTGEEALKSLELAFKIKRQVDENLRKFL